MQTVFVALLVEVLEQRKRAVGATWATSKNEKPNDFTRAAIYPLGATKV